MKKRGVIIILLITLSAMMFYGYRYVTSPVKTKTAVLTQQENTISGEAFVIRDEAVYNAENAGTLYSYVSEGSRVGKNMLISTVYRGTVDEELISELNNIDTKIEKLNRIIEQNVTFTTDNSSIENKIESVRNDIINAALLNETSKISEYKNTINYLSGGSNDAAANEMNQLVEQKSRMERQLSSEKSDIYSTISGIYSLNVDGYEGILTPQAIMEYRVGDFAAVAAQEVRQRVSNEVTSGEPVCKVVDNHNWYTMTVLSREKAEELRNKNSVYLRFDDLPGDEVAATVEYISEEEADETNAVVVLKSDRYLEGVYGIRSGLVDIIVDRYIGYEAPIHAVRNKDGKIGVMKAVGNAEIFCECDIVYKDEEKGSVIVYPSQEAATELKVGDSIVLGEKVSEDE